ncbi:MFS transporter [Phenylobacterium sp.]|uniref:MFS transporter n=1 Tax=Phenylobacterium sp. TaxID=1871053 RepID=UPI00286A90A9|nr:MFS transporter [Phenylobacterium sp.]
MAREGADYRLVILLVGLTQLSVTIDFSIVSMALPSIGRQLQIPPAALSWVISAGALAGGGVLILAGRAADIFGQRVCMLIGLSLFATGSLGAALSPDLPVLIGARALQGLGGAILGPANFSLINTLLPDGAPRRQALSVFGVMQGLSLVIGLLIGGILTTQFGWRSVFLLNPPLAMLAIVLTLRVVPKPGPGRRQSGSVDWPGAALITTSMALILLAVSRMGQEGWTAPRPLAMLAGGIVGFGLFFVAEARASAPLAPLSLFGRRNFAAANVIFMLIMAAVGGVFVLLNLYMQAGLKMTAMQSGLGMMPYAAAVMGSGQALPPLMARLPHRVIVFGGFGLFVLGLVMLALFSVQPNYWIAIALGSVVIGFGTTAAFMVLMADATSDIPPLQQGAATAVLMTSQGIGLPLGIAVALSVIGLAGPAGGLAAFRGAYLALAAMALVAVLVSLLALRPSSAVPRPVLGHP